ncbi:MAG: uroporphyrinogen decarboxylase family protein [Kiritimatiellia bacterium]|jgi:uroporphyrinogen decarboxylase
MTPRENLLRSLRRQGFEAVPVDCNSFCPSQREAFRKRFGHDDVEAYFNVPFRGVWLNLRATFDDARQLYKNETPPPDTDFDAWGVGHSHQPDCHHMTRMHHPLAGDPASEEIADYPLPTIPEGAQEALEARVREIHGRGLAVKGSMACTVWETAWYIRSMPGLMMDMLDDDPRATVLLDRVTALSCERIRRFAAAGSDIVELGDDIGMQSTPMMNPDLWRQWIKPRLAAVIGAGREIKPDLLIFYHSCGFVLPFLEDLIEAGVDILNPVQPECMDFADVHARTRGRLSYWGTIGTQRLLPFGTPDEVRATVRRNLDICGPEGGIVIGPTHMVEPEVPWENLEAMRLEALS